MGAFTFDGALQVDPKGNIFLPNVGPVKVAGVSNSQLKSLVASKVKEVYHPTSTSTPPYYRRSQ